ncbi:MAG: hypothetical protein M1831_001477 [Alyxoria varia]|nr:MAG: hypothetical protein M1831_001477 [Alyxoria varia]
MGDQSQPTTVAIVIATAIVSGLTGYFAAQGFALGLFSGLSTRRRPSSSSDSASDESKEEEEDEELSSFENDNGECKLVLVVRTDLGMTKGKIAAQCSHATLACYKTMMRSGSAPANLLKRWERHGQAKVAVQVKSEDDLATLQVQAMSLGVCAQVIHDAGRTQIASGSATVLGVGPAPKHVVDEITGQLKLL